MDAKFDLTGRLALVTGSSRGLGWAIARGLAGAGAQVLLHGRDTALLDAGEAELPGAVGTAGVRRCGYRGNARGVRADHAGVRAARHPGQQRRREPAQAAAGQTTDEDWAAVIASNLSVYFRLSREAARLMVPAKRGRIIMISSMMGIVARPTIPGYVTAKAGLHGMVRALSAELAPAGITVNAIAPGFFPTDATDALHKDPAFSAWIAGRAPMGRWGDPAELAGPAVFLASAAASYVTGHVLVVDGGLTAAL
jgi:gluconate 5-dehydrogenase